jgi:hypothetical protein
MSASLKDTPCFAISGLPKARRSFAYSVAYSNAARAIPSAEAATCGRECMKKSIAIANPAPSSPSNLSDGMRASSKRIEPVCDARSPSFGSLRPAETPMSPASTRKAVIAPSSFAKTIVSSAIPPFVT